MKNNIKFYILSALFFLFYQINIFANEFVFNTQEMTVTDNGNIINTKKGSVTTGSKKIKIDAKEFIYNKKFSILSAVNGVANLIDKEIIIEANKFTYNKKLTLLEAMGDVVIKDSIKDILIISNKISYDEKNQVISSNAKSIIKDVLGNTINTESFKYIIDSNLLKMTKLKIVGAEKNILKIDEAYLDLISKKIIGKDLSIDFNNQNFTNENEPRLNGATISSEEDKSIITKGVFTTCKKNDTCPPWQFSAEEIEHNKKKKIIYYKKAWLKIYDKPVVYFPRFFHPDPTVKRQSGFLMPSFQDSSSHGASFQLPYYHVISDNRDLTFSPRIYSADVLAQTEYREKNSNSEHLLDFSFVNKDNASTKSHLFLGSKKNLNFTYFDESELSLKIQQVTNDTYLKTYKLKSPLIKDYNTLNSNLEFEAYKEGLDLNINFEVYEDLTKKKMIDMSTLYQITI